MAKNLFNANVANNFSTLRDVTTGAKNEIKDARKNIMYFVNQLNKLQRKNEFVEGTNLHELGKLVRNWAIDNGHEVSTNAPFNIYLFTKVSGVICYKYTKHVNTKSGAFAISEDVVMWKVVTLSETGLVNAYKYILGINAKAADKGAKAAAAAANKAARKVANNEKAAARKALKAEQKAAIAKFNNGTMCAEEFATIMAKAI